MVPGVASLRATRLSELLLLPPLAPQEHTDPCGRQHRHHDVERHHRALRQNEETDSRNEREQRNGEPRFHARNVFARGNAALDVFLDRKSTRLNSSHVAISYAVFCLKKKKKRFIVINIKKSNKDTTKQN